MNVIKQYRFLFFSIAFVFMVNIFNPYAFKVHASGYDSISDKEKFIIGIIAIASGVVYKQQQDIEQFNKDVYNYLVDSGQVWSSFIVNDVATIPKWLIDGVEGTINKLQDNPIETSTIDSGFQQWSSLPNSPVSTNVYGNQLVSYINGSYNLYCSTSGFYYYDASNYVTSGHLLHYSLISNVWTKVGDSATGGFVNSTAIVSNSAPIYTDNKYNTILTPSNNLLGDATSTTTFDFTNDLLSTPSVPVSSVVQGTSINIPSTIPNLTNVTDINSVTGAITYPTDIAHTDNVSILQSILDIPRTIINAIATFFTPNPNFFNDKFNGLKDIIISKFPGDLNILNSLAVGGDEFNDISIVIMGSRGVIVSAAYIHSYIDYIRTATSCFWVFLLILYLWRKLNGFITGNEIIQPNTRNGDIYVR